MSFARRLKSLIDGSAPTQTSAILTIQKYVRHVIEDRPRKTIATLTKVSVPGSRYALWEHELSWFLDSIQEEYPDLARGLSPLGRKLKAEVEPELEDWKQLHEVMEQLDDIIDWDQLDD